MYVFHETFKGYKKCLKNYANILSKGMRGNFSMKIFFFDKSFSRFNKKNEARGATRKGYEQYFYHHA